LAEKRKEKKKRKMLFLAGHAVVDGRQKKEAEERGHTQSRRAKPKTGWEMQGWEKNDADRAPRPTHARRPFDFTAFAPL
jgi:hypothetical protein